MALSLFLKRDYWASTLWTSEDYPVYPEFMNYIVAHFEKMNSVSGMGYHIDRAGVYQADGSVAPDPKIPDKTKYSYIRNPEEFRWNQGEGPEASGLHKAWTQEIKGLARRPQKNAPPFIEFVGSASPEFFKDLKEKCPDPKEYHDQCETYFREQRNVLKKLYPYAKITKWKTHYEETTPHQHVLIIPLVMAQRRNKNGATGPEVLKYGSSEFLGGYRGLYKLHDELFTALGQKWGLKRGEKEKHTRHNDQAEFARKNARKEKELDAREQGLDEKAGELAAREKRLNVQATAIADRGKEQDAREKELNKKAGELITKEENITIKEMAVNRGLKDMEPTKRAGARLEAMFAENTKGARVDELSKIWEYFWKKVPALFLEAYNNVKKIMRSKKQEGYDQKIKKDFSKGQNK